MEPGNERQWMGHQLKGDSPQQRLLGLTSSIALGGHHTEALLCVTLHVDMMSRVLTFGKVLNLYKSEKWSYGQHDPWNLRYRLTKKITGTKLPINCRLFICSSYAEP